jgi:anti-sigma-K factor RskA
MSDDRNDPDEFDWLAAEFSLGLLVGEDLVRARRLARSDPAFARAAAEWIARLAPLLDEVEEAPPPAGLWQRIEAGIHVPPESAETQSFGNVVQLKRKMTFWQAYGAGATAIAAALAWLVFTRTPPPPPPQVIAAPPMVASLGSDQDKARLIATWTPASRQLIVAAAVAPAAAPGHSHELWMIAEGGAPKPMGIMPAAGVMRMDVPDEIAARLREGVTLAISVEPTGGSPTGLPTGPVIAAGKLVRA